IAVLTRRSTNRALLSLSISYLMALFIGISITTLKSSGRLLPAGTCSRLIEAYLISGWIGWGWNLQRRRFYHNVFLAQSQKVLHVIQRIFVSDRPKPPGLLNLVRIV